MDTDDSESSCSVAKSSASGNAATRVGVMVLITFRTLRGQSKVDLCRLYKADQSPQVIERGELRRLSRVCSAGSRRVPPIKNIDDLRTFVRSEGYRSFVFASTLVGRKDETKDDASILYCVVRLQLARPGPAASSSRHIRGRESTGGRTRSRDEEPSFLVESLSGSLVFHEVRAARAHSVHLAQKMCEAAACKAAANSKSSADQVVTFSDLDSASSTATRSYRRLHPLSGADAIRECLVEHQRHFLPIYTCGPPPASDFCSRSAVESAGRASASGGRQGTSAGVCYSFQSTGECSRGRNCPYSHDRSNSSGSQARVCYSFQNTGHCSRGTDCRYAHANPGSSYSSSSSSSHAALSPASQMTQSFAYLRAASPYMSAADERREQDRLRRDNLRRTLQQSKSRVAREGAERAKKRPRISE